MQRELYFLGLVKNRWPRRWTRKPSVRCRRFFFNRTGNTQRPLPTLSPSSSSSSVADSLTFSLCPLLLPLRLVSPLLSDTTYSIRLSHSYNRSSLSLSLIMESLSPSPIGRGLLPPVRRSEFPGGSFHTSLPSLRLALCRRVCKRIRVSEAAEATKNVDIDFTDPDWKSKFQSDFERRFRLPHLADVLHDLHPIPSTFCLKSRSPLSLHPLFSVHV